MNTFRISDAKIANPGSSPRSLDSCSHQLRGAQETTTRRPSQTAPSPVPTHHPLQPSSPHHPPPRKHKCSIVFSKVQSPTNGSSYFRHLSSKFTTRIGQISEAAWLGKAAKFGPRKAKAEAVCLNWRASHSFCYFIPDGCRQPGYWI